MPNSEKARSLDRDDLVLLMEAYRNQISSNTAVLEQQKQIIIQLSSIIDKQKEQCELIENSLEKFEYFTSGLSNKLVENFKDIQDRISKINQDITEDHGSLKNNIYIGWVGMGLIIVALLGLIISVFEKWDLLTHIAKKLGV